MEMPQVFSVRNRAARSMILLDDLSSDGDLKPHTYPVVKKGSTTIAFDKLGTSEL